jgi:cytochrome c oxidase subunit 2
MNNLVLFPSRASTIASHVDALMLFTFGLSVFFAVGIASFIIYFSLKYHHRQDADRTRPPTFVLWVEVLWTGVPLVLVLILFGWGAKLYLQERRAPANAMEIYVIGKQWMWKMQHPGGQREINELHIPAGRPIKLIMTSQDVIHSFFVPDFRTKQDVLPGRYTSEWFQATEPGRHHLFCTQYCGTSHSGMVGWIDVIAPADYEKWLTALGAIQPGPARQAASLVSLARSGEHVFQRYGCVTCHRPEGGGVGPSFKGFFGKQVALADGRHITVDETFITDCILAPERRRLKGYAPVMPTFQGVLNEEQLIQLVEYIKSQR